MTDDSAVTGHAAEGLETDRRAVDQLGDTSPAAKARRTVGRRRISWAAAIIGLQRGSRAVTRPRLLGVDASR